MHTATWNVLHYSENGIIETPITANGASYGEAFKKFTEELCGLGKIVSMRLVEYAFEANQSEQ